MGVLCKHYPKQPDKTEQINTGFFTALFHLFVSCFGIMLCVLGFHSWTCRRNEGIEPTRTELNSKWLMQLYSQPYCRKCHRPAPENSQGGISYKLRKQNLPQQQKPKA